MKLEFDPFADLGNVFHGAIQWAEEGSYNLDDARLKYFAMYPNNLGLTALLAGLFRIVSGLGDFDSLYWGYEYYVSAVIFNSMLVTAAAVCCVGAARRIAGYAAAFLCAGVFVVFRRIMSRARFFIRIP